MPTCDDDVNDDAPALPLGTEEEFVALLRELCVAYAPRRFALMEEAGERVDAAVVGWGLETPDRAVVVYTDGQRLGRYASAESACALHARIHPARLVWIDPDSEPGDELGVQATRPESGQHEPLGGPAQPPGSPPQRRTPGGVAGQPSGR